MIDRSTYAEAILSLVFSVLSIVCLFLILLVYSLLTPLQNLPGKNNMAFVSVFLIAQVMYLIGTLSPLEVNSLPCKIVGLITHFFWLLVVFWMNVCTFHMYHFLTRARISRRRTNTKRYLLYHLFCFVLSSGFVAVNVIVSTSTSAQSDFGYGNEICYISSRNMALFTFEIPMAIVIICNVVMFVVVVVKIKRTPTVQKNVKNERNYLAIFARLSTLTGLTWVFGFLYTWTGVVVFSYIFIILNGGQGVFLFVALLCNERVIHMLRIKLSCFSRQPLSSSSDQAMPSTLTSSRL